MRVMHTLALGLAAPSISVLWLPGGCPTRAVSHRGIQRGCVRRPPRGAGLTKFKLRPIGLSQAAACSDGRSRFPTPLRSERVRRRRTQSMLRRQAK